MLSPAYRVKLISPAGEIRGQLDFRFKFGLPAENFSAAVAALQSFRERFGCAGTTRIYEVRRGVEYPLLPPGEVRVSAAGSAPKWRGQSSPVGA